MAEYNSPDIYPNLNDQQFRLNKISEVETISLVRLKKLLMSKRSKSLNEQKA